jgi:hypothetical protein
MPSRYDNLRTATARLAAPAEQQLAWLHALFLPLVRDGDTSGYGNDELALQFEDYAISIDHMLNAGELTSGQADALRTLDRILLSWSGKQHPEFWTRDALLTDPRWVDVRQRAKAALDLLPA